MTGDGDIEAIFDSGDFDVPAVFHRSGSDTIACQGWFTGRTESTNPLTLEVEASMPMFDAPTSVISTVRRGDTVTIDDVTYKVERSQDNGTGITTVHLKT